MQDYIGTIKLFAGDFAPINWRFCDGSELIIELNQVLYSVIGNTYGGDTKKFKLPDLRGRIPVMNGQVPGGDPLELGAIIGTETVSLTVEQIPAHTHAFKALASAGTANEPYPNYPAQAMVKDGRDTLPINSYSSDLLSPGTMTSSVEASTGNAKLLAHDNMQPYVRLNYIICTNGIHPSEPNMDYLAGLVSVYAGKNLPNGWKACDGTQLNNLQFPSLIANLGNIYGGSQFTVGVPDLRGRTVIGTGKLYGADAKTDYTLAQKGGEASVLLTEEQMPKHGHKLRVSGSNATTLTPEPTSYLANAMYLATNPPSKLNVYGAKPADLSQFKKMNSKAISSTGKSKAHSNMMPSIGMQFGICTNGVFLGRASEIQFDFIGTIRMYAGSIYGKNTKGETLLLLPDTWLPCDGAYVEVANYPGLYDLVKSKFGKEYTDTNKKKWFKLPDLRASVPLGNDVTKKNPITGGSEQVLLSLDNLPGHSHDIQVNNASGNQASPENGVFATPDRNGNKANRYTKSTTFKLSTDSLENTGGTALHNNMQPYMAMNYIICVKGFFPERL